MPLTEKKGRFLVHTQCIAPPESPTTAEKRVKRGRFTISTCLPCIRGGRTNSIDSDCTLLREAVIAASTDADDGLLGPFGQPTALISRGLASQDSLSASTRDSTPCKDQQLCDTSSWGSSSSCSLNTQDSRISYDVPSPRKAQRRVRFSDHASSTPCLHSAQTLPSPCAAPSCSTSTPTCSNQPQQHHSQQPGSPVGSAAGYSPRPITRSYSRGRFSVQEAVLVCGSLPRSLSVPEHCTLEALLSPILHQHKAAHSHFTEEAGSPAAATGTSASSYWAATSAAAAGEVSGLAGTLSDSVHDYAPSAATRPADQQQPRALKRSKTVSYFRRGRFLVQTICA